jgi:hypothetical protein
MAHVSVIPVDRDGNLLFIKEPRQDAHGRLMVKYRSTLNDLPFFETYLYSDGNANCTINGDDGTVLFRFSADYVLQLIEQ